MKLALDYYKNLGRILSMRAPSVYGMTIHFYDKINIITFQIEKSSKSYLPPVNLAAFTFTPGPIVELIDTLRT